jgi:hypothetical protein
MDTNGTHFAFLTPLAGNSSTLQVGTAELSPASLSLAPTITGASATPAYTTTNGSSFTFACHPAPTNSLVSGGGVQAGILLTGIAEPALWQGSTLHDDGSCGDAVKGDGVYSDNSAYFYNTPTIGPRTLRFKAELLGADGNYHASAVDVSPFFVVGQPPTNPPPAISSITPSNVPPGSQVTLTGTGFDPIAPNNVILFGNVPAQVISVNPGGTQLVVVVPADAGVGAVNVSVGSQGQTGSPTIYNLPGGEPNWLEITMLAGVNIAGVNIHGNAGKTYRVDYLSDIHNINNWVPLATNVLPANPWFWADLGSTNQPHRYYRTVELP